MNRLRVDGVASGAVPALDRGLQYGDGLFETIAVHHGEPRLFDLHWQRLVAGCARLGMPAPGEPWLRAEIAAVAPAAAATVKVIVTRGQGPRGYRPPPAAAPTCIVAGFEAGVTAPGPWAARLCATPLGRNRALAGLKHLNRLEQVLARAEWDDPAISEGLMLDDLGRLVCGTQTNLFALIGGRLLTPRVDECGVAGVMRRAVLEWAADLGLPAGETGLWPADLSAADEVFVTNALIGAQPLGALDGQALRQGSLSRRFMEWLDRR